MIDSLQLSPAQLHLNHFKNIITMLVQKFRPLQIICFGKRTVLRESSGSFMTQAFDQEGHYCLLMVTEGSARIDHEVQDFTNAHYKQGSITVLCHSKDAVNAAISSNSRFFIGAYVQGHLLYSHDGLTVFDIVASFVPDLAAAQAQEHFEHRSKLAEGFLQAAAVCLSKQQYNVCAFLLHQVVEQCCIALVRVYMDYRLEMHNLSRLLHLCLCFSEKPLKIFISGNSDDESLLKLLVKSYSQSRYNNDFAVACEQAKQLYDRVVAFLALTRTMCGQKILELQDEAVIVNGKLRQLIADN